MLGELNWALDCELNVPERERQHNTNELKQKKNREKSNNNNKRNKVHEINMRQRITSLLFQGELVNGILCVAVYTEEPYTLELALALAPVIYIYKYIHFFLSSFYLIFFSLIRKVHKRWHNDNVEIFLGFRCFWRAIFG